MPGLTYSTYKTQIAEMAVVAEDDVNFLAILPAMIDYASNRICRDLDLMFTSVSLHNNNLKLTTGNRNIYFAQNFDYTDPYTASTTQVSFVVSEQINLILGGTSDPDAGSRVPLLPTTKEFLDVVYGSASYRGQPKYFAPFNETLFFVGPTPDTDYYVEVVGTVRPAPLSETVTTTFISQYLPDLLIMASMVYISAYQRNFGRQSDDPQMAQSYETQYQTLLRSAGVEEARKKFEGPAWSSQSPSPISSPTRG